VCGRNPGFIYFLTYKMEIVTPALTNGAKMKLFAEHKVIYQR
jgi:hypothetical protein